jgi:CheY-like chemotaxis protein
VIALIVDDEPVGRRVLKRLLSRFSDLDLREAENGDDAWAMLGEFTPGVILCDLSMPGLDGVGFIKMVRAHDTFGKIPIIVTSASKDRDTLIELKDLNILDYLLKPFELAQTFSRLEKQIEPLMAAHRKMEMMRPRAPKPAPAPAPLTPPAEPAPAAATSGDTAEPAPAKAE